MNTPFYLYLTLLNTTAGRLGGSVDSPQSTRQEGAASLVVSVPTFTATAGTTLTVSLVASVGVKKFVVADSPPFIATGGADSLAVTFGRAVPFIDRLSGGYASVPAEVPVEFFLRLTWSDANPITAGAAIMLVP